MFYCKILHQCPTPSHTVCTLCHTRLLCSIPLCIVRMCVLCAMLGSVKYRTQLCIVCMCVLCAMQSCCVVHHWVLCVRMCVLCAMLGSVKYRTQLCIVRMYCVLCWAVLWQYKQGKSNPLHIVTSVEVHKINVVERKD